MSGTERKNEKKKKNLFKRYREFKNEKKMLIYNLTEFKSYYSNHEDEFSINNTEIDTSREGIASPSMNSRDSVGSITVPAVGSARESFKEKLNLVIETIEKQKFFKFSDLFKKRNPYDENMFYMARVIGSASTVFISNKMISNFDKFRNKEITFEFNDFHVDGINEANKNVKALIPNLIGAINSFGLRQTDFYNNLENFIIEKCHYNWFDIKEMEYEILHPPIKSKVYFNNICTINSQENSNHPELNNIFAKLNKGKDVETYSFNSSEFSKIPETLQPDTVEPIYINLKGPSTST